MVERKDAKLAKLARRSVDSGKAEGAWPRFRLLHSPSISDFCSLFNRQVSFIRSYSSYLTLACDISLRSFLWTPVYPYLPCYASIVVYILSRAQARWCSTSLRAGCLFHTLHVHSFRHSRRPTPCYEHMYLILIGDQTRAFDSA